MNRKLTGIAAAVVLALVGTLLLVGYVRTAEARALAGEEVVDVLVATEAIEAGTPASELRSAVRTEQVPVKVRADGAVVDLKTLKDQVTSVDLLPGEQLVTKRFVAAGSQEAGRVPDGMHEVTLALEAPRALGGRVAAGDTVAVMGSVDELNGEPVTRMLLQKVLVTAVQVGEGDASPDDDGDDAAEEPAPEGELLVTLALPGPDVEKVVFAAEHGRVWLSSQPQVAPVSEAQTLTKGLVFP